MTPRAFIGRRLNAVDDPTGLYPAPCAECTRTVLVEAPLVGGDRAFCERPCAAVATFRGGSWLYVNPEHQALSRRLKLPFRDALDELPPELAALANADRRFGAN